MFIFYDTETTGTNTVFDQVLQFAAILTDNELREVDRFEIRCRCLPWVVPAPMALKVTGITPGILCDQSLPSHYEMFSEIRERLNNWGPAVYAGYNSMRFDEPILQRAFWQTLHPPYLTVTNGNARIDILPLVQAASHLYKGVFNYPETPRGRTGFKLDQLAPMNGFAHEKAHDALADVEATIFIAKILANNCQELWESHVAHARKSVLAEYLQPGRPFLFVEHFISGPSVWWGQRVDQNKPGSRLARCLRLDANWNEMFELDLDVLERRLTTSPKPLRDFALNKAPIVLDQNSAQSFGFVPANHILRQSEILATNKERCSELLRYADKMQKSWPAAEHLEQSIFERFPSHEDSTLMEKFHRVDWIEKARLVHCFEDRRLKQLAQRIIFLSRPDLMAETDRQRIRTSIAERLHADHENPDLWRTIGKAFAELSEVINLDGSNVFASDVKNWLCQLSKEYPPVVTK